MPTTYELVKIEVLRTRGWITAGTIRWKLPKGARVKAALERLEREGWIRPLPAWWSDETVWERTTNERKDHYLL